MNKVIITGATGFIGKYLVKELVKQEVEIIAVVRENSRNILEIASLPIKIIKCNISDYRLLPELITDRDIDAVFHFAWQGVSDLDARDQAIQIQNLQSTLDLIDAMVKMSIKTFVGAGSLHEVEAIVEMQENKTISNMGYMYKSAKIAAHWMGKAKSGNVGIRFFWPLINTYGEGEKSTRLINTTIRKIVLGEEPALSNGNQYYDFVHVEDVAHALYLIAEKGVDGANYVIGSGQAKPLKEFLKVVGDITNRMNGGTKVPLGFGQITANVVSLPKETFDVANLFRDTGFVPKISFDEGIIRTVKWIIGY